VGSTVSVSGGRSKPCFIRLWDVDVKPRGSSRPRGFSVNGWLGKADLGLAHATLACSSYNPETLLSLDIGR
jgi:hypothetical protein